LAEIYLSETRDAPACFDRACEAVPIIIRLHQDDDAEDAPGVENM